MFVSAVLFSLSSCLSNSLRSLFSFCSAASTVWISLAFHLPSDQMTQQANVWVTHSAQNQLVLAATCQCLQARNRNFRFVCCLSCRIEEEISFNLKEQSGINKVIPYKLYVVLHPFSQNKMRFANFHFILAMKYIFFFKMHHSLSAVY